MNYDEFYKLLYDNFGVKLPDKYDQDWEYTAGDAAQIQLYINFYKSYELSDRQKQDMINMIIQGFDDLLIDNYGFEYLDNLWKKIEVLLVSDIELHKKTIEYWACLDNESDDECFYVSKYMRKFMSVKNRENLYFEDII